MFYINNLTNNSSQQLVLTGIPGIQIGMLLRFLPRVRRWVVDITYGDFSADGIAVVNSPNLLRQWKNNIPFGMACVRSDGLDPYTINDFSDQLSSLYLLDGADVATVEADFFTGSA